MRNLRGNGGHALNNGIGCSCGRLARGISTLRNSLHHAIRRAVNGTDARLQLLQLARRVLVHRNHWRETSMIDSGGGNEFEIKNKIEKNKFVQKKDQEIIKCFLAFLAAYGIAFFGLFLIFLQSVHELCYFYEKRAEYIFSQRLLAARKLRRN